MIGGDGGGGGGARRSLEFLLDGASTNLHPSKVPVDWDMASPPNRPFLASPGTLSCSLFLLRGRIALFPSLSLKTSKVSGS